ncbi:GIY-YIG nuclease family protein [Nonomuraea indica]|uniref:GIY-YIG nuclease family protein n=1 Tax=Nonomuraea indica TaxID=1581193 RepID=UPI001C5F341B|nr:GIY-YIG nuclease family protein [Nonomuraea indica]
MTIGGRTNRVGNKPAKKDLPAPIVQDFRKELDKALQEVDDQGRKWGGSKWGVYAFFDYDGEPIYVGQTNERLAGRVKRHLTNQRTDAVAMRILDVFEVAELELWPLWDLQGRGTSDAEAKRLLDEVEYSAYLHAIENSKFKAILNEKIPPKSDSPIELPPSRRFKLVTPELRRERGHPDTRIARRADMLARLSAVAHERGEVSTGLRRVLLIQAIRLTYLAATRLAYVEGRPEPDPSAIDASKLIGQVLVEEDDPEGSTDMDELFDVTLDGE